MNCENRNSKIAKIANQELLKSQCSYNDINHNDFSDLEYSINQSYIADENKRKDMIDRMEYEQLIKDNIDYDNIQTIPHIDKTLIDEIVNLMTDIVCTKKTTIRINGEDIPSPIVKNRFLKISDSHIEYVCECLNKNTTKVKNIRSYLLTVLYNSTMTIDNFYRLSVNHDLYGDDSC